jgi:threonine/homoserine/homoserine lactone efflux protein
VQHGPELFAIAAAIAMGAVSPGPSFVLVARTAVSADRTNGLLAALGMGLGGLTFAVAALLGLHSLLLAVPSLYVVLKVGGGLYLVWLGVRLWRSAKAPMAADLGGAGGGRPVSPRYLWLALTTQLSNPKAAIVYAGVFAAFMPSDADLAFKAELAALVFVVEAGWYALVAIALSAPGPRGAYLRARTWLDRAAGGFLFAIGVKLVASVEAG